ncbi:DUF257 family protein [Pyrococcus yayanosii]|uniref:Uncharacterized protein n=1 Tax=Pyrococcus yayanosii (strain CH1 / JCM 16557) TaxID=529709 RepID=F8AJ62_PYRYC|nr:DUF257 family protein [Pyrococcus yayanosii]AEH24503.1 hypothetical protein PYCH_08180 [Pyrococcus yayanosii CH1]
MTILDVLEKKRISILVEHTSEDILGPTIFDIIKKVKDKYGDSIGIIITDFLDTLAIYKYQAELLDLDTSIIENAAIIKVGGKINVGNVLHKIPVSAYPVYKTLYEEALGKVLTTLPKGTFSINIQLGIENIMNIFDKKELIEQVHDIGEYIVTKEIDIRDIVFLNVDAIKKVSVEVLSMLRMIFPVVIRVIDDGHSFVVKKSVFPELKGARGKVIE